MALGKKLSDCRFDGFPRLSVTLLLITELSSGMGEWSAVFNICSKLLHEHAPLARTIQILPTCRHEKTHFWASISRVSLLCWSWIGECVCQFAGVLCVCLSLYTKEVVNHSVNKHENKQPALGRLSNLMHQLNISTTFFVQSGGIWH